MDKRILLDLANESVRKHGGLSSNFSDKMVKRIKRKFSIEVEANKVSKLSFHYKDIYKFTKSILKEHINPSNAKYAKSDDVDVVSLLDRLAKQFSDDDFDILHKISDWVIYYEYLR